MINKGLAQYKQVDTQSAIEGASPHRLIQMLMNGALQRLAEAKGAVQRKCMRTKGEAIGKAISIVGELQESLNHEAGGEIASNLDSLYDYIERRLLEANMKNSEPYIDEVVELLRTIKSGWDEIAAQAE